MVFGDKSIFCFYPLLSGVNPLLPCPNAFYRIKGVHSGTSIWTGIKPADSRNRKILGKQCIIFIVPKIRTGTRPSILSPRGGAGISALAPEGGVYQNRGSHSYRYEASPLLPNLVVFQPRSSLRRFSWRER